MVDVAYVISWQPTIIFFPITAVRIPASHWPSSFQPIQPTRPSGMNPDQSAALME